MERERSLPKDGARGLGRALGPAGPRPGRKKEKREPPRPSIRAGEPKAQGPGAKSGAATAIPPSALILPVFNIGFIA